MYDSPITLFETFDTVVNEVTKKHNKTVMAEIQSKIGIDIDEKALTQALIQDKERYQEAYRRGYEDGKYYGADHGLWVDHINEMECSVCHTLWNYCDNDTHRFNYCPNCGAKMDEEAEK